MWSDVASRVLTMGCTVQVRHVTSNAQLTAIEMSFRDLYICHRLSRWVWLSYIPHQKYRMVGYEKTAVLTQSRQHVLFSFQSPSVPIDPSVSIYLYKVKLKIDGK